jgi:predicted alpha/beta-fold hydrolase
MPVISPSTYRAPWLFANRHVQTMYPTIFRKVHGVSYERERINTPDDDFIDLDWSRVGAKRIGVVLHGLEGNSGRGYVMGMVKALNRRNWDGVAFNYRGCSGEPNQKPRFYHSGDTDDLQTVVKHVAGTELYDQIALIGFSIGGNMVLKYLGERGTDAEELISKAVAFSVPCDLASGAQKMTKPSAWIYWKRFHVMLCDKVQTKAQMMPGSVDPSPCRKLRNFSEFDNQYTAPMHGFKDAQDYWERAASKPFLTYIKVPTLLVSAADDPFLTELCYPIEAAESNDRFFLEIPSRGGHVGFVEFNDDGEYWSEKRALAFLE